MPMRTESCLSILEGVSTVSEQPQAVQANQYRLPFYIQIARNFRPRGQQVVDVRTEQLVRPHRVRAVN